MRSVRPGSLPPVHAIPFLGTSSRHITLGPARCFKILLRRVNIEHNSPTIRFAIRPARKNATSVPRRSREASMLCVLAVPSAARAIKSKEYEHSPDSWRTKNLFTSLIARRHVGLATSKILRNASGDYRDERRHDRQFPRHLPGSS